MIKETKAESIGSAMLLVGLLLVVTRAPNELVNATMITGWVFVIVGWLYRKATS